MAKGQIHMGKNGPEKCSVDTSKPRSRGCPYEATGHYSSAEEAIGSYAKLNRVDLSELKELVADGASPKDAVGLIRSGYGRDYLEAAKKDSGRTSEATLDEVSSSYLEAKTQVALELEELAPGVTVEGSQSSQGTSGVLIRKVADQGEEGFSFVVQGEANAISFEKLSVESTTKESEAVGIRLQRAIDDEDSSLRDDLAQMLQSYKQMTTEEAVQAR